MNTQQVAENTAHFDMSFMMVRSDRIAPFPEQPRKFFDQKSIEELATSIETEGQRTPVQLCKGTGKSKPVTTDVAPFVLIDGERRWRACALIAQKTGKPFLMKATIEMISSVQEHFQKSFGANFGREDMAPLEIAAGLKRLKDDGVTLDELAKRYSKSMKYVIDYLSLNNLEEQVKRMMDPSLPKDRRLGVTHSIQIARVKNSGLQIQLAHEAIEHGLSVQDLTMSVENAGFHRSDAAYDGAHTSRNRHISDDRAILTNLLRRTESSLSRVVSRMRSGQIDLNEMYNSAKEGDAVFFEYEKLLTSIGQSVLTLNQKITQTRKG